MAKVQICNVNVLNNPSAFNSPFQFELTFECIEELQDDLEWKMIYVGSAESEAYDQILDTVLVGPVAEGRHMFVFEADPPDATKIPVADAIGVTVVLLTCSYKTQEFVRIGYFINNEYNDPELKENPPTVPEFDKVTRNILGTKPRVTRFKIYWDESDNQETCTVPVSSDITPLMFNDSTDATDNFDWNSSEKKKEREGIDETVAALLFSDSSCSQNAMEVS